MLVLTNRRWQWVVLLADSLSACNVGSDKVHHPLLPLPVCIVARYVRIYWVVKCESLGYPTRDINRQISSKNKQRLETQVFSSAHSVYVRTRRGQNPRDSSGANRGQQQAWNVIN